MRITHAVVLGAGLVALAGGSAGATTIAVGGNSNQHLKDALTTLGYAFTDVSPSFPAPGSADILIIGEDGGNPPVDNYTSYLDGGGKMIITGGSGLSQWGTWAGDYINNTYLGWHTDGAYQTVVNNAITQFMPSPYTPDDSSLTYHMMHFNATPNTVLYAQNGEGAMIGAIRDYGNGGWLNYMAMDLGPYGDGNDVNNFTVPFLKGALQYNVPAPGAAGLLGFAGLAAARRRR